MEARSSSDRLRRDLIIAFMLPMILLAPFAGKAFHIDDTPYLWVAQQIHKSPLDFYGFEANWYDTPEAMYLLNYNPPGIGYFLAAVAYVFGWGEVPLHLATSIMAALLSVATYLLARRLTKRPLVATLTAILTPMFVVTSQTLMTDVPMLTAYVWGVMLWVYGLKNQRGILLFAAACAMTLSVLFKYPGLTVVPLLFAYTWAKTRKIGPWALYFIIPLAVVFAYGVATARMYDVNLIGRALGSVVDYSRTGAKMPLVPSLAAGLTFTGGTIISALFFGPYLWSRKVVRRSFGVAGALTILGCIVPWVVNSRLPRSAEEAQFVTSFLMTRYVFLFAGIHLAALAVRDLLRTRDAEALLLFLWAGGTFVFATVINWSVTVRILLPALVPMAIIVARSFDELEKSGTSLTRRQITLPLVLSACMALSVAWGDYCLASGGKTAAEYFDALRLADGKDYYYQGHWGFQYYMEERGMAYNVEGTSHKAGDRLVIPQNASELFRVDTARTIIREDLSLTLPMKSWVTTLNPRRGAGFYTNRIGRLPYTFGIPPAETYKVYEFLGPEN